MSSSVSSPTAFNQGYKEFFQTICLVAHAGHMNTCGRQFTEELVERLSFLDLHLHAVIVKPVELVTAHLQIFGQCFLRVEDEYFPIQLLQQPADTGVLNDFAVVDDGDVATEALRLLKVVGSQNNG